MTTPNTTNIIITIGNSDVQTNNQNYFNYKNILTIENRNIPKSYLFKSPFYDGKKIYQNIHNYYQHLRFPIVSQTIEYIKKITNQFQPNTTKVFLITTNQPQKDTKNSPNPFKSKDTYYYGEIIKYHLQTEYKIPIQNIKNLPIKELNLIHYDQMFNWFQNQFNKNKIEGTIYFVPQGGIDAINFNLMLYLIRKYPNLHQLFISENNTISSLQFPKQIQYYSIIQPLINHYQYDALLNIPLSNKLKDFLTNLLSKLYLEQSSTQNDFKILEEHNVTFWLKTHIYIAYSNQRYPLAIQLISSYIENEYDNKILTLLHQHYKVKNIPNNNLYKYWRDEYNKWEKNITTPLAKLIETLNNQIQKNPKLQELLEINQIKKKEFKTHELNIPNKFAILYISYQSSPNQINHITNYYNIYKTIKDIRNQYAHQGAYSFKENKNKTKNIIEKFINKEQREETAKTLQKINDYIKELYFQ